MGYDVSLYLGNDWSMKTIRENILNHDGEPMQSFEQVAEVRLCCVDLSFHNFMSELPTSNYYIWSRATGIDSEPKITSDMYNDFKMITGDKVKEFYTLMLKAQAQSIQEYDGFKGYRRYDMALGMLRSLLENFDRPVVIWYGS